MARKTANRRRSQVSGPRRVFRPGGGLLKSALKWAATLGVWAVTAAVCVVGYYATDLPDVNDAAQTTRRASVTVLDTDGRLLHRAGDLVGVPVTASGLPPAIPQAVLAIEDRRFYDHAGVDVIGLGRAMARNLMAGRVVQGGSTITQQLAKNLFLTPERTIKRKVQEVLLAFWLEHKFTKDQILTLYLNRVYLGSGTYGVDAAARRYFGRGAKDLSVYEAAMLAGMLKAPSRLNPVANKKAADKRTRVVLAAMEDAGYLSAASRAKAMKRKAVTLTAARHGKARYFVDWVLGQVPDYVRAPTDLVVRTTLRTRTQGLAERALEKALSTSGKRYQVSQGAVVVMSPAGAVRALVGGRDHAKSQFNRAVQAARQPGSAFKPIVYLSALETGMTPDSAVVDEPVNLNGWSPRNFDRKYRGSVTLKTALQESLNTPAARLTADIGPRRVRKAARRLGLGQGLPNDASIGLGTGEVTLLELTSAYGAFANGGRAVWPHAIEEIRTVAGDVLYRRQGSLTAPVVAAAHVNAMNEMLRAVIDQGTGGKAKLDRPAGGKTGTSQDFRDAWFVGYTADLVAGVWLGNDNGKPMRRVTGGGLPALIWRDVMRPAHQDLAARSLPGASFAVRAEVSTPQSKSAADDAWTKVVDLIKGIETTDDPFNMDGGN